MTFANGDRVLVETHRDGRCLVRLDDTGDGPRGLYAVAYAEITTTRTRTTR